MLDGLERSLMNSTINLLLIVSVVLSIVRLLFKFDKLYVLCLWGILLSYDRFNLWKCLVINIINAPGLWNYQGILYCLLFIG